MLDAGVLQKEIAKVCPVIRTAMGKLEERATWSFVPTPEATQAQIDAGNNVIATIPIDTTPTRRVSASAFIGRWTDEEYALMLKKRHEAILEGNVSFGRAWDTVMATDALVLNGAAAKDLKQKLVTAGVLTQVRADLIFE
jgi:hypothetical protein